MWIHMTRELEDKFITTITTNQQTVHEKGIQTMTLNHNSHVTMQNSCHPAFKKIQLYKLFWDLPT